MPFPPSTRQNGTAMRRVLSRTRSGMGFSSSAAAAAANAAGGRGGGPGGRSRRQIISEGLRFGGGGLDHRDLTFGAAHAGGSMDGNAMHRMEQMHQEQMDILNQVLTRQDIFESALQRLLEATGASHESPRLGATKKGSGSGLFARGRDSKAMPRGKSWTDESASKGPESP